MSSWEPGPFDWRALIRAGQTSLAPSGRLSRRVIGLANVDGPRGRQAVLAWWGLDRRTRREVVQWAWRGLGHPDPRVAAIAVGRAQATLTAPLWRWVAPVGLGLPVALAFWPFSRVMVELDIGLGAWIGIVGVQPIAPLLVIRMQARQMERANPPMVG